MNRQPDPAVNGAIHLDVDKVGHVKEWPGLLGPHNVTWHATGVSNLTVEREDQVHIHNLERGFLPDQVRKDGTKLYTLQRDEGLRRWFAMVRQRANIV